MLRIAGVLAILVSLYCMLYLTDPKLMQASNLVDVANRQGFYGIITLGVAVLIITGAIDLSIGSVVGFAATGFGLMMMEGVHPVLALVLVLIGGVLIGTINGILVTRLKLQPFLVTLCGMFVYKGAARYLSERPLGLVGIKKAQPDSKGILEFFEYLLAGKNPDRELMFPAMMLWMLIFTVIAFVILQKSVFGRYWYAIGYNESAAKYAGISTNRMRMIGFVVSSTLASLGGIMFLLDNGSADPTNAGDALELYAITGAVLGGCSLKGGEGTAIGILLGAAVLPLLKNVVSFQNIPDAVIPAVIGVTLLFGTIADEFFRRRSAVGKK